MSVTIYHNPRCGKSRQTLQLIQAQGIEPEIVEYLKNPPRDRKTLITAMITHPILIERPIVLANGKAAIGRPPEAVLAIL
ncbi:MAG: hypothetical protein NTX38_09365 [Methylobacter sp.]|nr:hypothetical protein [Methylobacter sp.]